MPASARMTIRHIDENYIAFAHDAWTTQTIKQLDLKSTVKPRVSLRKAEKGS